jgi:hypothetical protein
MKEALSSNYKPTELKHLSPGSFFFLVSDINKCIGKKIPKWKLIVRSEKLRKSTCRNHRNCFREIPDSEMVIQEKDNQPATYSVDCVKSSNQHPDLEVKKQITAGVKEIISKAKSLNSDPDYERASDEQAIICIKTDGSKSGHEILENTRNAAEQMFTDFDTFEDFDPLGKYK